MQNQYKPLFLNPAWLAQIGAEPLAGFFMVYSVPYSHHGKPLRVWQHRTLRAAGRRLGSVIAGKLRDGSDHATFCIAPDGTIHNWYSANERASK